MESRAYESTGWNYVLREEIGERGKEGRHVFLADRILREGQEMYEGKAEKVVIKSTDCTSAYLRYTLTELNCLRQLHHPGIPTLLEFHRDSNHYHLVLPYVDGCSLKEQLEEGGSLELHEAVTWLIQLGEILVYLHRQTPAILYRDLKPEHIIIDRNGKIYLLDFDGVLMLGERGDRIGNYRFSAPEQFEENGEVDVRSDIFAFGKVAQLLLLHIPQDIMGNAQRRKWRRFLERCTCEKKEKRYREMEEVLRALRRL